MSLLSQVCILVLIGAIAGFALWTYRLACRSAQPDCGESRSAEHIEGIPSRGAAAGDLLGDESKKDGAPCLTVVLCTDGLPDLKDWNAQLAELGLDVFILPPQPALDGESALVAQVRGEVIKLTFAAAPMKAREEWFPPGQFLVKKRKGAALLGWWLSDQRASAAAWSIAATLAHLSSGKVFEGASYGGTTPIGPYGAFRRAESLLSALPDNRAVPQADLAEFPGPGIAQRYEETGDLVFDVEASTEALKQAMLRSHDELTERCLKLEPDESSDKRGH